MKQLSKKFLSLLLCLALMLVTGSLAFAEDEPPANPVFTVSAPQASAGGNVFVNVSVADSIGFCAGELLLSYDPAVLTPTEVLPEMRGDEGFRFISNTTFTSNSIKVVFLDTTLFTRATSIFTVSFTVSPTASGSSAVNLTIPKLINTTELDEGFERVANTVVNTSVTIREVLRTVADAPINLIAEEGLVENILLNDNSVAHIKTLFQNTNIRFLAKDGLVLTDTDRLSTGCTVQLTQGEEILQEAKLVSAGDVDGDCRLDAADAFIVSMIIDGLVTRETIGDAAYEAADVNYDGFVNEADYNYLLNSGLHKNSGQQAPPVPGGDNDLVDLSVGHPELVSSGELETAPEMPLTLASILSSIIAYFKLFFAILKP